MSKQTNRPPLQSAWVPEPPHLFSRGRPSDLVFQTIRSDDVAPSERYHFWTGSQVRSVKVDPPDPKQRQDFRAKIVSMVSLTKEMHYSFSDGFSGERCAQAARSNNEDDLALLFVIGGRIKAAFDREGFVANAGDFFLYDSRLPQRVEVSRHQLVQIDLPRLALQAIFAGKTPTPALVNSALASSGLSPLLKTHLMQFPNAAARMATQERHAMLEASEDFVLAMLRGAMQDKLNLEGGSESTLIFTAQRFIEKHLDHPSLSPAWICAVTNCSRATLYRAFKKNNLTVAGYIRERRLQRLYDLLQTACDEQPIAKLAQRCGLLDPANLSQLFRRRFGVSPRGLREGRPLSENPP
ncbi:helix-turn-helix domain-containing protein [Pusillimonas sp.]|uniref:helix-turn-helix domain-containing protein n=1 Tax=Pusillimonas sp. TaxID=3040095 RepID=UPI0037C7E18D